MMCSSAEKLQMRILWAMYNIDATFIADLYGCDETIVQDVVCQHQLGGVSDHLNFAPEYLAETSKSTLKSFTPAYLAASKAATTRMQHQFTTSAHRN